jgi:hypothetical protein
VDNYIKSLAILLHAFGTPVLVFISIEAYRARKPLIPLDLILTSLGAYCLNQLLLVIGRSAVRLQPLLPGSGTFTEMDNSS